jgi:rhodanese-related sulfurtransferase
MHQRFIMACWLVGSMLACSVSPTHSALFAYAALQTESVSETYPKEISVERAAAEKDAGAFILDVRETSEWTQFHIPGAVVIPLGQLGDRLGELPRDKAIVVVCHSGARSAMGLDIIRKAGFGKSSSMTGGLIAWQAAGYPVESGG